MRPVGQVWAYGLMIRDWNSLPEERHGLSRLQLSQGVLNRFPGWWQHFSFCSLSASCSQVSCREVWQSQSWPEGPASPVLASGTSASYLISDPGFFYTQSCFPMNKGRNWLVGSISIAGSIHSSFLWNSALYFYYYYGAFSETQFQNLWEISGCNFRTLPLIIKNTDHNQCSC